LLKVRGKLATRIRGTVAARVVGGGTRYLVFGFFDVQQPSERLFRIGSLANPDEIAAIGIRRVRVFSGHVEAITNPVQYASLKGRLRATSVGPIGLWLCHGLQLLRLLADVA